MQEQQRRIAADRGRIAVGERPRFHVITCYDGIAVDVRIRELPLVYLFVPEAEDPLAGARCLVARTLGVPPSSFDLGIEEG